MDDLARYNKERWEALAAARIEYSRPFLNLDANSARRMLDPAGLLGSVGGKDVLCLAGGGGQQSAAFGLLGARVTVLDLAETQLERDREAAAHYGHPVRLEQGDMRDLSRFGDAAFDIVWQPHSINFVPDACQVFGEVVRVLRDGGLYRVDCHNPFTMGIDERDWTGAGYPLRLPYVDGEMVYADPDWDVWGEDGSCERVTGPREFRHTLATFANGLIERGFRIIRVTEDLEQHTNAAPGTGEHFRSVAPPGLSWWTRQA